MAAPCQAGSTTSNDFSTLPTPSSVLVLLNASTPHPESINGAA
ncbi:hypothetical protein MY3296_004961 [Beauveria thailandica]